MNRAKWAVLAALALCPASYIGGRVYGRRIDHDKGFSEGYEAGYFAPHPADTVFRIDTLRESYPAPVAVTPAGYELAPIGTLADLRAQVDSLAASCPDTVEVYRPVPMERQEYRKPNYYAVVSGYHPSLEHIETYNEKEYITNYVTRPAPRWSFGATAGLGVVVDGQGAHAGPAVAVGLHYRF